MAKMAAQNRVGRVDKMIATCVYTSNDKETVHRNAIYN